ncbi:MAG TPA: PAS domain S-box protein [Gemmatimonadales bacterium]|nr:PAS domain S-box protein [Gemmatimonadales bacterium]
MTHSLLNRPDRLAALRQTALLDTPSEEGFDRLTRMAARLLGASTALITLVADDRQFFKSAIGLPEPWATRRTAPLSFSFCAQVVATGEPLVLEDARKHPLLGHSPAIRELGWISYAGVPLITRDRQVVGAFCVVDRMPRLWSERDIALLQDLAGSAVTEIELRREITRRRQAELGERDSQEQFQNTFEQVGIGMALISLDGRWLRVNRVLSEMLGTPPDLLIGYPAESRTDPDDAPADREAIRLLLAGECRTYTMEKRFLRPSGEVVWGLVNVSLVIGPEGEPAHLIAAITDVTDRRQAERELREREERYRLLAQASKESVREWDLGTDQVTWDQATAPLLDYARADLGNTPEWWYERIHSEDRERVVGSIDAAIAQDERTWSEGYRFRRADGSFADLHDRASIVRDESGKPLRLVGAMTEAAEPRSDHQLQEVLDALPTGVWVVNKEGHIVLANAASKEIWGGTPETALSPAGKDKARWTETGQPVPPEEWGVTRALEQGESSSHEELTVETADGAQRIIQNSATPMRDPGGEIVGAVNLSEDVTAKKMAEFTQREQDERQRKLDDQQREEQLRQERQQQEERQRQQDHELQTQKMDAIGRLAGGIAHDFNNLLTGVLSYSDLILQELRPNDPIRADVEQIRDAGQRAAGLTRQLLAFSRRQLLHPRVVSLNTTVTDLEPMLQRLLGAEVSLETDLDPDLGKVLADPAQVEQALVNLALNAREAMPEGGRLRITTSNLDPDPTTWQLENGTQPEAYVCITISDTGIGMDEVTQSRIFEPFFTTKRTASGRGLGLATVYGIVEQSGGQIGVQSAPGQGTTFTIYLPRYWGPEAAVGTADQRLPQVGTETLLLVEDEAAVRASVRRLLEWHGYTVLEARNGEDALRVYEDNESGIDLVLTDLVMPEMGGHELVERLRARHPGLRVLFMSGYTERAFTSNGAMPLGTGFVEKPFTVETLMRRLREVLDT